MEVNVVFLSDFFHGRLNAVAGRSQLLEQGLAEDLERAGLLRIAMARPVVARTAVAGTRLEAGKVPDDGRGQPSSASPPAQVSPPTTLHLPARGPGRPPKIVTS